MAKFILNDETKINSYGFRILNKGIDLTRFKANPVMLNQHENHTSHVIGRWKNIRVQGALLIAESDFDIDDETAKVLSGKVERGFIKSCSMGVAFAPVDMVRQGGVMVLLKCELYECSICAIPSNANAITLYTMAGTKLNAAQIQKTLSLSNNKNNNKMDLLTALIEVLQLDENATEQDVLDKVKELVTELQDTAEQKADEAIEMAVLNGSILSTEREFYKEAAKENLQLTLKLLNKQKPKTSLLGQVITPKNNVGNRNKWTLSDYRKHAPEELEKNPALFDELYQKEFEGGNKKFELKSGW